MWALSRAASTTGPQIVPPSHLLVDMGASCGNRHGAVTATASLDVVAVHAWCSAVVVDAHVALLLSVVVDVFEVEGVDVTREKSKKGQTNVDGKICAAAREHEDTDGGHKNRDDNQEDV
jgi:hypothetical protein